MICLHRLNFTTECISDKTCSSCCVVCICALHMSSTPQAPVHKMDMSCYCRVSISNICDLLKQSRLSPFWMSLGVFCKQTELFLQQYKISLNCMKIMQFDGVKILWFKPWMVFGREETIPQAVHLCTESAWVDNLAEGFRIQNATTSLGSQCNGKVVIAINTGLIIITACRNLHSINLVEVGRPCLLNK